MISPNLQRLRRLASGQPQVVHAKLVTEDGTEIPFDGRFPTDVGNFVNRKPAAKTPREDQIDMDGPKTHRIVCMHESKVSLDGQGNFVSKGDIAWVTGDIAKEMERKGLATIVEVRDLAEVEEPRPAKALRAAKPKPQADPELSDAEQARRKAAGERMKRLAAERKAKNASAAG
jgi:hypothetical protein